MPDGSRRSKRFSIAKYGARDAKRRALTWTREMALGIERGAIADPRSERTTFKEWATDFQTSERPSLRASTIAQHEIMFRTSLVPTFGKRQLGQITQRDVQ